MISFECPKCHAALNIEDNQAGMPTQCPQCGNVSTAPEKLNPAYIAGELKSRCSATTLAAADEQNKKWCALCHIGGMMFILSMQFKASIGILPLVPLNILLPMIIWLMKKDDSPQINQHAKTALNFQITATIIYLILCLLGYFIGLIPLKVAVILNAIFSIIATIKIATGREAKYPFIFRFIS